MQAVHVSLLLHLIALALLGSTLVGGWILQGQYSRTADPSTRLQILRLMRPFGLLSPLSVALFLISGIGNMTLAGNGGGYTIFSDTWLTAKLLLFVILVAIGIVSGIRGKRRVPLAEQMVQGKAPQGTPEALNSLNTQQRSFLIVQTVLVFVILALSISKPHAY